MRVLIDGVVSRQVKIIQRKVVAEVAETCKGPRGQLGQDWCPQAASRWRDSRGIREAEQTKKKKTQGALARDHRGQDCFEENVRDGGGYYKHARKKGDDARFGCNPIAGVLLADDSGLAMLETLAAQACR